MNLDSQLVEFVIVVVIIGTIAAIAVPRISRGAGRAGDSALRANLKTLRSVIDVYAAEHSGTLPGADGLTGTFHKQLTENSASDGRTTGPDRPFGPYIRTVPRVGVGPFPDATDIAMVTTTPFQNAVPGASDNGWIYNYQTGELIANTDDLDDSGVGYDTY